MRSFLGLLLSILLLCACDGELNSSDPSAQISNPTAGPGDAPKIVVEGAVAPSEGTCLTACKPEPIANIAFSGSLALVPETCKVKDFRIFPFAQYYLLITWADCLEGYQIYASKLTLQGDALTDPKPVSQLCYQNFQEVQGFAADTDGQQVLISYGCRAKVGTSYYLKAYAARVDGQEAKHLGSVEFFSEISYYSSNELRMSLVYNLEAQAFAVTLRGSLYRFDKSGKWLGGAINLYQSNYDLRLQSFQGSWYAISQPDYSNTSSCSKVNSYGVLACDRKTLDRAAILMTSSQKVITKSTKYSSGDEPNVNFEIASFNPETCSMSVPQVLGGDRMNSSDRLMFAEGLSGDIYGLLYEETRSNTLKLGVFQHQLNGKILSLVSVAPILNLVRSRFLMQGTEMHVFYLDSLGLRMSRATVLLGG